MGREDLAIWLRDNRPPCDHPNDWLEMADKVMDLFEQSMIDGVQLGYGTDIRPFSDFHA